MSTASKKKSNKGKVIAASIILIIAAAFSFYRFDYIKAFYLNSKQNHFKTGDRIYASETLLKDTSQYAGVALFRISRAKHAPFDYRVVYTYYDVRPTLLNKLHSKEIGTYKSCKLVPLSYNGKRGTMRLYAIDPNWKAIDPASLKNVYRTDPGYEFTDNIYYISGTTTSIKQ